MSDVPTVAVVVPIGNTVATIDHCLSDCPTALVGGRVEPFDPQSQVEVFAGRPMDQAAAVSHKTAPHVITAHMLARRSDLLRIGLFDEALLRGPDVDLSLLRRHLPFGKAVGSPARYAGRCHALRNGWLQVRHSTHTTRGFSRRSDIRVP